MRKENPESRHASRNLFIFFVASAALHEEGDKMFGPALGNNLLVYCTLYDVDTDWCADGDDKKIRLGEPTPVDSFIG